MSHQEPTNADIMKSIEELSKKVQPVVIWFDNFTIGKKLGLDFLKTIAWVAGIIIALGGAGTIIWTAIKYAITQAK